MTDALESMRPPVADDGASPAGVLPRRLGLATLTLLIIAWNAPIAAMAGFQQLSIGFGNGIGAPLSFLVSGAILLLFAVGFLGMTRWVKNPGAFYCYIVDGLGKIPGLGGAFIATAAYILFAAGSYVYLGLIAYDMTNRLFGDPVGSWQLWAFVSLAVITVLGLLRIDMSMKVIGALVLLEVVLVAAWELAIGFQGGPGGYSGDTFSVDSFTSGSVGLGVLFAMLCMIGFEGGACFRDETRNPERNVGRATYIALAFLAVFYAIGCWAYIVTQGPADVVGVAQTDPVGSFFTSIDDYLGSFAVHLVTVVLVTSQAAAIISIQGNGSRYLFALGRDGVLSRRLASVHPRLQSPHVAVLVYASFSLVALLVIAITKVDAVQSYAALTGAGIYFLLPLLIATSVAIIVFFRRHPQLEAGPWVGVVAPAVSAVALTVLFVLTTRNLTILTITSTGAHLAELALVLIALAGVLLALRLRSARPEVYKNIGNQ